jgi:hypothetical protein
MRLVIAAGVVMNSFRHMDDESTIASFRAVRPAANAVYRPQDDGEAKSCAVMYGNVPTLPPAQ